MSDSGVNGKPNLPGVIAFFRFFATFLFIPFKYSARDSAFTARPKRLVSLWVILGPFLTALHTASSCATLFRVIAVLSSNASAWGDVRALIGLALANILLQTNASITAYGISVFRNYDEVLHFSNQIIRYRSFLNGEIRINCLIVCKNLTQ